ncbi:hypothetical protein ABE41_018955 [Fictibacillus arsenicus]|uniref:Uncharacterized protein n=1 Tax=Fictibacillus arsenicus TaxID=255247 RepID=A0A1B1Z9I4_9BACL|nr:hypothetical protein ABE41_018955 [Fictibacillus arsenicus]
MQIVVNRTKNRLNRTKKQGHRTKNNFRSYYCIDIKKKPAIMAGFFFSYFIFLPLKKFNRKTITAMTRRIWMIPPATSKRKPSSHNTNKIAAIVQSMSSTSFQIVFLQLVIDFPNHRCYKRFYNKNERLFSKKECCYRVILRNASLKVNWSERARLLQDEWDR